MEPELESLGALEESIVPVPVPAPVPIELELSVSSSICASEGAVSTPEAEPVLASEPMVELAPVPVPVPMELLSVVDAPEPMLVDSLDEDMVFAMAGRATAAITSDVQTNFFIKPPLF